VDEQSGKLLDAGLERTIIQKPVALSFEEATELLESHSDSLSTNAKQAKILLAVLDRNISLWKEHRLQNNEAAQKREKRLQVREMVAKEMVGKGSMRDDGARGSFQRSRGHRLVDSALDLYGSTLSSLLIRVKAPIPRASGNGMERGGRLGTAPLRRYIDGVAQRQALSVLCNYGGPPMTRKECSEANKIATEAINKINNLRSSKKTSSDVKSKRASMKKNDNKKGLRMLETHFAKLEGGQKRLVSALSTGKENEIVISGVGILTRCDGVQGTLKSGEKVLVQVTKLDAQNGALNVRLERRKD